VVVEDPRVVVEADPRASPCDQLGQAELFEREPGQQVERVAENGDDDERRRRKEQVRRERPKGARTQ
jgi:hypothetical protein